MDRRMSAADSIPGMGDGRGYVVEYCDNGNGKTSACFMSVSLAAALDYIRQEMCDALKSGDTGSYRLRSTRMG